MNLSQTAAHIAHIEQYLDQRSILGTPARALAPYRAELRRAQKHLATLLPPVDLPAMSDDELLAELLA